MLRFVDRVPEPAHYTVLGLATPGRPPVFSADSRDYDATFPILQPDGSLLVIGIREPPPEMVKGGAR